MSSNRLIVSLLTGLLATGLAAQEEASASKPDPALKDQLKQFKSATEDLQKQRDQEATGQIDRWLQDFEDMHEKDQAAVRKALGGVLTSSRVKRDPEQRGLFTAAAVALGRMGPEASKMLVKAFKSSKFKGREWVVMRAVMIKSIGTTKDPKQVEFLIERAVRDPEDKIMQAAGEALGNHDEAPQKVRKDIAKELIKKFNEIEGKSRANLDPGDPQVQRAKETLAAVSRDWNETLRRMTGQTISSAAEWQHFYNKNKGKNWDKMR